MTDGATKMRKLQVGIMDSSKHVKYVEQAEEIDYKFKISKMGNINVLFLIIMIRGLNYWERLKS